MNGLLRTSPSYRAKKLTPNSRSFWSSLHNCWVTRYNLARAPGRGGAPRARVWCQLSTYFITSGTYLTSPGFFLSFLLFGFFSISAPFLSFSSIKIFTNSSTPVLPRYIFFSIHYFFISLSGCISISAVVFNSHVHSIYVLWRSSTVYDSCVCLYRKTAVLIVKRQLMELLGLA